MDIPQPSAPTSTDKLESALEVYLVKKAPYTLPPNVKEIIVKLAPWLNLIGIVLILPLLLAAVGLYSVFAPLGILSGGYQYYTTGWVTLILSGVTFLLELIAIPGLFKRSLKAWRLLFYAMVVRALIDIIHIDIGSLILMVLSAYLLFQVKEKYR